jgi:hypothetical protein
MLVPVGAIPATYHPIKEILMNKQQIFDAFDGKLSKTCIKQVDGQWRIIGRDVEIEYMGDDCWDFYVRNIENIAAGIGTGRVNNVLAKFSSVGTPVAKLNGEGYTQGSLQQIKSVVLANRAFFGIPKKRELSEEQLENMRKNLGRE